MVKRLTSILLLTALLLSGCSSSQSHNQMPKLSTKAKTTIEKVSKNYGEPNPKIKDIKSTEEETTNKPMYFVFMEGNFHKGEQSTRKLEFSMLKDCTKVWSLTSDSWQETKVSIEE